jgi:hypothetical protein
MHLSCKGRRRRKEKKCFKKRKPARRPGDLLASEHLADGGVGERDAVNCGKIAGDRELLRDDDDDDPPPLPALCKNSSLPIGSTTNCPDERVRL